MSAETIEAYHANPAISHSKLECYRRRPAKEKHQLAVERSKRIGHHRRRL
jgi:hypothetical protein